jgi:hypothetical protein
MQFTACEKEVENHGVKSSTADRQFSKPLSQTSTNQFKNNTSIMESNISKFSANITESNPALSAPSWFSARHGNFIAVI